MTKPRQKVKDELTGKWLSAHQIRRQREIDRLWDEKYEELQDFHMINGHPNVLRSDANQSLASWVHAQRNRYAKGVMYKYQIDKLKQLGFVFVLGKGFRHQRVHPTELFTLRLEQLRTFRKVHGHVRVPKSYRPNPKLSSWFHQLRVRRRKNYLTLQEIEALDELGFEWQTKKTLAHMNLASVNKANKNNAASAIVHPNPTESSTADARGQPPTSASKCPRILRRSSSSNSSTMAETEDENDLTGTKVESEIGYSRVDYKDNSKVILGSIVWNYTQPIS